LPDIFSRAPDLPKIKIIVNEYGQPVGDNVKRFTRVIGCIVRRKLRVNCSDWRLVDAEKKFEVWTDMKSPRSEEDVEEDEVSDHSTEDEFLLVNRRVVDPTVVEQRQGSLSNIAKISAASSV